MKLNHTFQPAPGLYISDLEYHEQGSYAGYITAYTTFCGRYVRETVFRVHDSQNKRGMCLVRIEQSHLHPAARRYWNAIEQGFIGVCKICGIGTVENSSDPSTKK